MPRSVGVVGECPAGTSELMVEADAGGQPEQLHANAHEQTPRRAGAVTFDAEQVLAGPDDGLDALADRGQVRPCVGLIGVRRAHKSGAQLRHRGGEGAVGVALVGDHRLTASERPRQEGERHLAFGAVTRATARGVPSGAQARCRRHPQNQCAWLRE